MCSVTRQSAFADFIQEVSLLIWDECSMQHHFTFEAVDRSLQDLRKCALPFGGIPSMLGGNFLQTLPIVKCGGRSLTVHACLTSSPIWPVIYPNILTLHENMQLTMHPEDRWFAIWLRKLARGNLNHHDSVSLPSSLLCTSNSLEELIQHIYPRIKTEHDNFYFAECCILCPGNRDMHAINSRLLDTFPGPMHKFWAVDKAVDPDCPVNVDHTYTLEFLHVLSPSSFPPTLLCLKTGSPIIILRNLQPKQGVCNRS